MVAPLGMILQANQNVASHSRHLNSNELCRATANCIKELPAAKKREMELYRSTAIDIHLIDVDRHL